MKLQTTPPPVHLKKYVQFFWRAEGESGSFAAIADGCPGLIFHKAEQGMFQHDKKLSPVFLYGQTTRLTELKAEGRFQITGLCFYPHMIKSLFGLDANELTDTCIDLNTLPSAKKRNLAEQLLNTVWPNEQIEIISSYLNMLAGSNNQSDDNMIASALSVILQSNGEVSLKELHKKFQLTERTFERRFEKHVGISPKLFSRICRFQASLNQLKRMQYTKLSDIAFENGYADQSHFIRTFKEFTGHSPNKFQKTFLGEVSDLPVLTY